MRSALDLAALGLGAVEPNPAVGCVIVTDNRAVGSGRHERFGGPHAEVNALADCRRNGHDPAGATMYVTLEPCCHMGKTPPCTDAIIAARIARIFVACRDPSPHAAGRGIRQLRRAGIAVSVGLCRHRARLLNAPFFKFVETGRPWVIVKWAQTLDGQLAFQPGSRRRWISNAQSRADAHELRRRVQAILVGVNTVIADNPQLTPRPSRGRRPLRVVLDSRLRTPPQSRVLRAKKFGTLIVTTQTTARKSRDKIAQLTTGGAEVLPVRAVRGRPDLLAVLDELARRGVQQVLVEGGPTIITSFLRRDLADAAVVYLTGDFVGEIGPAAATPTMNELVRQLMSVASFRALGDNIRLEGIRATRKRSHLLQHVTRQRSRSLLRPSINNT